MHVETGGRALVALVRSDSTAFDWRTTVGTVHTVHARVLLRFGEPEAALPEAPAAVRLLVEGSEAGTVGATRDRADAELALGRALLAGGRTAVPAGGGPHRRIWGPGLTILALPLPNL